MRKVFNTLLRHWVKNPLKISLTLLSVALGTGILVLSFSAGIIIDDEIVELMNKDGIIVQVANGEWDSDGTIDRERPPQWDKSILEKMVSDSELITDVTLISQVPVDNLSVNGKAYEIRSITGTDTSYIDVFSLNIIAGSRMSEEDFNNGLSKVWISEETANMIFGSATEAIGQHMSPPGSDQSGRRARFHISQFTVAGVYESPTEVARRAYGIADIFFPATSMLPSTNNRTSMLDYLTGNFVVKSKSTSFDKTAAEINQIAYGNYGSDLNVVIWEGNSSGESSYMDELRQTVTIFTVSVNILGIVLLLTSSLGIFSIMVVEALGRRKEIAIERALGASKLRIINEFWQWSVMLSLLGAIIGTILAFAISGPVLGTMTPLLSELSDTVSNNLTIKPLALLSGITLALGCGGILGVLPAFTAVKGDISDTLREG